MVINPSLPAVSPQLTKPSAARPAVPPPADSNNVAPTDLSSTPEITGPDEARQSQDFVRQGMLNQSSLAMLAQSNLSPETVYNLLQ